MRSHQRRKSDMQAPAQAYKRFGVVAVHRKFSTAEQVRSALLEQLEDDLNGREHRPLGAILFDRGWIGEAQIELILEELQKNVA